VSLFAGKRVLVTRAEGDAQLWAEQLRVLGAEPIVFPCIVCSLEDDLEVASQLVGALSEATWLVLCSRRGVQAVAGLLAALDSCLPPGLRIATVGPATEADARSLLGRVDLVARGGTAQSLCDELSPLLTNTDTVVAALTQRSDDSIQTRLGAGGAAVVRIDVYRSAPTPPQERLADLAELGVEVALLASPSAVTGLLNRAVVPQSVRLISIGPSTSAAVRAAGLTVYAEAAGRGLDAMLQTLETSP